MSMTQPMTTLTCGQCAPLLLRSSPVPRSTFAHCARLRHVFLRYGLRRARADYFANTEVFAFQGILAPAGLPAAITARLNGDLNKALLNPAVVKRMNDFGMEALPGTPEQFRAMARAESKRWGEIIKAAGVKLD